jgi:hypothetical protein
VLRQVHSDDYLTRQFDLRQYNCWHLVRDVWRDMTGVDLGDLTPPATDVPSLDAAAWDAAAGPRFERLGQPRQPCVVLMRRRREMPHVGVLMRWRLLHMTPECVRHEWLSDVVREWDSLEFYLPRPSWGSPAPASPGPV